MNEEVLKRLKILAHSQEFGLKSSIHAFGVGAAPYMLGRLVMPSIDRDDDIG
ncbi:hypothetical protein [Polynucleobacter sp. AM-25C3]|jgi:hypothetical protein|uniref:hypothetical protein n=1 Tax=Polynucleobacter sp. AM-25C3 TaxID=1855569 RepID=UPI001C0CEFE0|nr:hypothetical protein [Polynucleobacter sp. AM-25C3]MBU3602158.1 hypothetical protein [Polynucleobacter sp. AM-25C3]